MVFGLKYQKKLLNLNIMKLITILVELLWPQSLRLHKYYWRVRIDLDVAVMISVEQKLSLSLSSAKLSSATAQAKAHMFANKLKLKRIP
jgi:hypothetical protein